MSKGKIASGRRRESGGQAIVLVTLALFAMTGMMGLAVDLGWSFFVQKHAQAAADAAALGAVQEAQYRLKGNAFGFTCPVSPSGPNKVYCQPTAVDCTSGAVAGGTDSNLWNGCKYADKNGFVPGGRQRVTIQANETGPLNPPPTAPLMRDAVYYATVRTTQVIPQLFSAVNGNATGVVSAVATAALTSVIVPGSFIALNQAGDCITDSGHPGKGFTHDCGVDVDLSGGAGSQYCTNPDGSPSAAKATLCGGAGIVLASTCHGSNAQTGCDSVGTNACGNGGSWAGCTSGSTSVWGISTQIQKTATDTGWVNDPGCTGPAAAGSCTDWTPKPTNTDNQNLFKDPKWMLSQPPIAADSTMPTCAIPGGTITGTNDPNNPLVVGPYQYYASTSQSPLTPTGNPIVLKGAVKFDASGICANGVSNTAPAPSGSPNYLTSQFPAYLFYGGLWLAHDNYTFGPGQYVMVGTNSQVDGVAFSLGDGGGVTVNGDNFGTQFITTAPSYNGDPGYPGLSTQMSAAALAPFRTGGSISLYQGDTEIKAGNASQVTLYGLNRTNLDGLPPTVENLGNYSGDLFWQDRRNSTLQLSTTDGSVVSRPCYPDGCATIPVNSVLDRNRVTFNSPKFLYASSANLQLHGAIYQPRGAWLELGGNPNTHARIQIVTGAIVTQGGGQLDLLPTDAPLIKYIVALIQ